MAKSPTYVNQEDQGFTVTNWAHVSNSHVTRREKDAQKRIRSEHQMNRDASKLASLVHAINRGQVKVNPAAARHGFPRLVK